MDIYIDIYIHMYIYICIYLYIYTYVIMQGASNCVVPVCVLQEVAVSCKDLLGHNTNGTHAYRSRVREPTISHKCKMYM